MRIKQLFYPTLRAHTSASRVSTQWKKKFLRIEHASSEAQKQNHYKYYDCQSTCEAVIAWLGENLGNSGSGKSQGILRSQGNLELKRKIENYNKFDMFTMTTNAQNML